MSPAQVLVLREEEEVRVGVATEPGEAHHVSLSSASRSAGGKRVPDEARGAGADGAVVPRLALGVLSTSVLTGRPTVVVVAGAVQGTLGVVDALSPGAADERVAPPAGGAGAHRTVDTGPVEPCLAVCPGTTRIGAAQVFLLKLATADEGIASVTSGTGTDCLVVG